MKRYLFSALALAAFLVPAQTAQAQSDLVVLGAAPTGPNTVIVRVRNQGNAWSVPCRLAMWVHHFPSFAFLGGPYLAAVPALAPGQYASVQVNATVVVNAQRYLRFFIDYAPPGLNAESNENNNHYALTVP